MSNTVIKTLPFPWKVGGKDVNEIEVRPPLVEDLIEAEKEAHPGASPTAFGVALACRQLVRAGDFTGPFVTGHFKGMKPKNWYVIREACDEADRLGEAEQLDPTQSS